MLYVDSILLTDITLRTHDELISLIKAAAQSMHVTHYSLITFGDEIHLKGFHSCEESKRQEDIKQKITKNSAQMIAYSREIDGLRQENKELKRDL